MVSCSDEFSGPKSPGLVEAYQATTSGSTDAVRFPGLKAPASLKLFDALTIVAGAHGFSGPKSPGLVEA